MEKWLLTLTWMRYENGERCTHRHWQTEHGDTKQTFPERRPLKIFDFLGRNSYYLSMKTVVSEKGQITIPKKLRDRMGIRSGQVLEFQEKRGVLVATKIPLQDPVEGVYGILTLNGPTDKLMGLIRGERNAA